MPQRDVYTSLGDCQRDWPGAQYCEPVRDSRYSNSWFYGPSYFGETWPNGRPRASQNAIEALHTPQSRTPTASASRSYWSSGSSSSSSSFRSGSSSSSSSVSRGGFGGSASSSGG